MNCLMISSLCLLAATLPISLIRLAFDWESIVFKFDWKPMYPYDQLPKAPSIDRNIITEHLLEEKS